MPKTRGVLAPKKYVCDEVDCKFRTDFSSSFVTHKQTAHGSNERKEESGYYFCRYVPSLADRKVVTTIEAISVTTQPSKSTQYNTGHATSRQRASELGDSTLKVYIGKQALQLLTAQHLELIEIWLRRKEPPFTST
jgi:hypothetical protein